MVGLEKKLFYDIIVNMKEYKNMIKFSKDYTWGQIIDALCEMASQHGDQVREGIRRYDYLLDVSIVTLLNYCFPSDLAFNLSDIYHDEYRKNDSDLIIENNDWPSVIKLAQLSFWNNKKNSSSLVNLIEFNRHHMSSLIHCDSKEFEKIKFTDDKVLDKIKEFYDFIARQKNIESTLYENDLKQINGFFESWRNDLKLKLNERRELL